MLVERFLAMWQARKLQQSFRPPLCTAKPAPKATHAIYNAGKNLNATFCNPTKRKVK
jgi:hypothetical protein